VVRLLKQRRVLRREHVRQRGLVTLTKRGRVLDQKLLRHLLGRGLRSFSIMICRRGYSETRSCGVQARLSGWIHGRTKTFLKGSLRLSNGMQIVVWSLPSLCPPQALNSCHRCGTRTAWERGGSIWTRPRPQTGRSSAVRPHILFATSNEHNFIVR
jgi:hypothetical protein